MSGAIILRDGGMSGKLSSVVRLVCVSTLVFFIPKAISLYVFSRPVSSKRSLYAFLGVENLSYFSHRYKDLKLLKFALLCNDSSVDQLGNKSSDLLKKNGFDIQRIFCVKKLKKLSEKSLCKRFKNVDAVFLDMQGNGLISDQSVSFLRRLVSFSARYKKKVIILDRPNPLGGIIEGPGKIPWRYGTTIGEMAIFYNKNIFNSRADIKIIPLINWKRGRRLSFSFLYHYRHNCFLLPMSHIKPIKVNRDKCSFSGLSTWEVRHLKRLCWKLGLHCFGSSDKGVRLSLKSDIVGFSALNSLLTITRFLKNRKKINLSFRKKLDKEIGSSKIRRFLQNRLKFSVLKSDIEKTLVSFYDNLKDCCLYKPFPVLIRPEIIK
jgi:hypothetical protein